MNDLGIIELYFARDELAIKETDAKYGKLCHSIAYNILNKTPLCDRVKNIEENYYTKSIVDDYLSKKIDVDDIKSIVEGILSEKGLI